MPPEAPTSAEPDISATRRRWPWLLAVAVTLVVTAGLMAVKGPDSPTAPLSRGSTWGPVTSSADAWNVSFWNVDEDMVVVRPESGATLTIRSSLTNNSPADLTIVDQDSPLDALTAIGSDWGDCRWLPTSIQFWSIENGNYSWEQDPLSPPFALAENESVLITVDGVFPRELRDDGVPRHPSGNFTCAYGHAAGSHPLEVPIQYEVFDRAENQLVPLDLTLVMNRSPEDYLQTDVTRVTGQL